eukprot:362719-Chlamydomonas_euryale.AAC.4
MACAARQHHYQCRCFAGPHCVGRRRLPRAPRRQRRRCQAAAGQMPSPGMAKGAGRRWWQRRPPHWAVLAVAGAVAGGVAGDVAGCIAVGVAASARLKAAPRPPTAAPQTAAGRRRRPRRSRAPPKAHAAAAAPHARYPWRRAQGQRLRGAGCQAAQPAAPAGTSPPAAKMCAARRAPRRAAPLPLDHCPPPCPPLGRTLRPPLARPLRPPRRQRSRLQARPSRPPCTDAACHRRTLVGASQRRRRPQ